MRLLKFIPMLNCFIDYIGLSYCEGQGVYDLPPSGIYINSLPGLNLESIQKIADQEQATYKGVWKDVQASAVARFRIDVINEIKKCYALTKDCDYDTMICDNIETLVQPWKYICAIWILIFRINSNRINRFTTIDLEKAKELLKWYEGEYAQALNQTVMLMDVSSCDLCCGGNPQTVVWLP